MDKHSSPQISSFVLRFVQEEPEELSTRPNYRGSVRHIQTDQEYAFTRWIDALNFMRQFIPEEVFDFPEPPPLLKSNQESDKISSSIRNNQD